MTRMDATPPTIRPAGVEDADHRHLEAIAQPFRPRRRVRRSCGSLGGEDDHAHLRSVRPGPQPSMTHEERRQLRKRIAERVRETKDRASVASEFSVSLDLVTRACREHGVDVRANVRRRNLQIAYLLGQGDHPKHLAERFHVPRQTINDVARDVFADGSIEQQGGGA